MLCGEAYIAAKTWVGWWDVWFGRAFGNGLGFVGRLEPGSGSGHLWGLHRSSSSLLPWGWLRYEPVRNCKATSSWESFRSSHEIHHRRLAMSLLQIWTTEWWIDHWDYVLMLLCLGHAWKFSNLQQIQMTAKTPFCPVRSPNMPLSGTLLGYGVAGRCIWVWAAPLLSPPQLLHHRSLGPSPQILSDNVEIIDIVGSSN